MITAELDTAIHSQRVTALALRIAAALDAAAARVAAIRAGAPVHDIGKLALDPEILCKPAALAPDELAAIRRHPELGVRMLRGVAGAQDGLDCVLHHHERWDGTGYPHGLRGDEIPIEARIVAVADAYDAMTSDRPYRRALSHEEAVAEVERCAGTQFDPQVAAAFLSLGS
jgi:HD-GYP domain-containing protein (c-di-GMP phosphodiesterase class II)